MEPIKGSLLADGQAVIARNSNWFPSGTKGTIVRTDRCGDGMPYYVNFNGNYIWLGKRDIKAIQEGW